MSFYCGLALLLLRGFFGGTTPHMRAFQAYFALWLNPENPHFREGADALMPNGLSIEQAGTLSRVDFFIKLTEMFAAQMKPID